MSQRKTIAPRHKKAGKKPRIILSPDERAAILKAGYVHRGETALYGGENTKRQTKEHRIAEMQKMKFDRVVRINIGTDEDMGGSVVFWARSSYEFHEGVGGIIVLLPTESERDEAAKVFQRLLDFATNEDKSLWKRLLSNPSALSKHCFDVREQLWQEEKNAPPPPPVDDSNPDTWPHDRWHAAIEDMKGAAAFAFIREREEYQRAHLAKHSATKERVDEIMTVIRDMIQTFNNAAKEHAAKDKAK